VIVTVSREYGAASQGISAAVADRLGYRLVSRELPVVVAARLGMPADVVETVSERPRPFGERVLDQFSGGVPETSQPGSSVEHDLTAETQRAIEVAVREIAAAGNAVIVGRLAGAILGARPDLVRVFVHAPLAWRVAHVAGSFGCSEREARAEISRIDEARRTYAKEFYQIIWDDRRNYDLMLQSSRFGVDGSAEIIVAAVRAAGG
jgi:cytidylate kinase